MTGVWSGFNLDPLHSSAKVCVTNDYIKRKTNLFLFLIVSANNNETSFRHQTLVRGGGKGEGATTLLFLQPFGQSQRTILEKQQLVKCFPFALLLYAHLHFFARLDNTANVIHRSRAMQRQEDARRRCWRQNDGVAERLFLDSHIKGRTLR